MEKRCSTGEKDSDKGCRTGHLNRPRLQDFREAVGAALGDEGEPVLDEDRLRGILNELPGVYALHRRILNQLESRLGRW